MKPFEGKRVLVTGGTGSLGKVLVNHLLSGTYGFPKKVIVFSRDEAKQDQMRVEFSYRREVTAEVIYAEFKNVLDFRIGDVTDFSSVASALRDADIVINAAAMKQVPTCEYYPYQAVKTNIIGAETIVRAISEMDLPVETVVGISTDKACKPVNVMGCTKSIQERIFIGANKRCSKTKFVCVRYGNVLASRGSVIPLFLDQIKRGGPVTITTTDMTRFVITLDQAVLLIAEAVNSAQPGEIYVSKIASAKVTDIAKVLIGDRPIETRVVGIRPGEKSHEVLISDEEVARTMERGGYYVVKPILREIWGEEGFDPVLSKEFSSADHVMDLDGVEAVLRENNLMPELVASRTGELLV
jgi:UDP-glucose 4-epimerase